MSNRSRKSIPERRERLRSIVDANAPMIIEQANQMAAGVGNVLANVGVDLSDTITVRFIPFVPPEVPPALVVLPDAQHAELTKAIEMATEAGGLAVMATETSKDAEGVAAFVALALIPEAGTA
jgi:hypothetical protein